MSVSWSFLIGAQKALPAWARGRGLGLLELTFQMCLAGGAAIWGMVATHYGAATALEVAGALVALSTILGLKAKLAGTEQVDVRSCHPMIAEPQVMVDPADGPVLVTVEDLIPKRHRSAFQGTLAGVRRTRRREGAIQWSIYEDLTKPDAHLKSYVVSSWTEHQREGERRTTRGQSALDRAASFHLGPEKPVARYLLGDHFRRNAIGTHRPHQMN